MRPRRAYPAGGDAPGRTARESLLLRATDELDADAFITDATWKGLAEFYSTEQLLDIVFTVGQYNLVSMALNTCGVSSTKARRLIRATLQIAVPGVSWIAPFIHRLTEESPELCRFPAPAV
ncbi:MAG: hypothetical protein IPH23_09040 [Gammaproteobacteria bacterium]|nr:hypothetical protein [Gammaproteobacteria bacterium]